MTKSIVEKTCTKCKTVKPLEDFNACCTHKDGRSSACRECNKSYWHKRHPIDRTPMQDLPDETWKPCVQNSKYAVSNLGRTKRLVAAVGTRANKLVKQQPDKDGYLRVGFGTKGVDKGFYPVHQVVAYAFIGAPPEGCDQINHINGIKTDNRVENLEWCDTPHNIRHRDLLGHTAKGTAHPNSKLTEEDIPIIRQLIANGTKIRDIANQFNVSTYPIMCVKKNKWWKHVKEHP